MCGICGFNWNDPEQIGPMTDTMTHRGPDQRGTHCEDGISLGHRRLSIIDLSELGRQPMTNEDGTVWLAFNGEIYNYLDLREDLLAKGHVFASHTDSEVIIHAYEQYGVDMLEKLRGMFSIAIWDRSRKSLFVARDRIGIKPLYYYHKNGRFIFGSEIKSILHHPEVDRRLNAQALYDYLGFEFVPAPATMFEGISKLPAGHFIMMKDGSFDVHRYWDLDVSPNPPPSYDDAIERQREILDDSVKSHLMSDVPLGVFLSGGLDSSALVAMMRRHITGRLQTFTIGYPDKTFSELDYAKQVADYFDTDHTVLMIEDMSAESVEKALWHLDEPMTDLSSVPLMLVCEQARKHVTVCLSGEGGDESYAGYDRFKAHRIAQRAFGWIPRPILRNIVAPPVMMLPDQPQKKGAINMLKRFVEGSVLPPEGRHLRWQYFGNAARETTLFSDRFRGDILRDPFRQIREYAERCLDADDVNQQIYLDMRFMMTDSVLMKVDKMSMANALEVRVPLLDHVLVEYMASLPGDWKLKGLRTKHVFRSALKGMLPENIVERGKQGYSLPVKHLLRGQLKGYMTDLLNGSSIVNDTMDTSEVNNLISEHIAMKHNHNHILWALMNVAIWQQRFGVMY